MEKKKKALKKKKINANHKSGIINWLRKTNIADHYTKCSVAITICLQSFRSKGTSLLILKKHVCPRGNTDKNKNFKLKVCFSNTTLIFFSLLYEASLKDCQSSSFPTGCTLQLLWWLQEQHRLLPPEDKQQRGHGRHQANRDTWLWC